MPAETQPASGAPAYERPGLVGALLRPGRGGAKVEDVIYMNLAKGLFALADGSARAPGASRRFMARFADLVERFQEMAGNEISAWPELRRLRDRFRASTEALLGQIPYGQACTFTALLILRTQAGPSGYLLHCGDSLLFRYEPGSGIRKLSKTNFWLVGRTRKLFQAEEVVLSGDSRLLLATDGIRDLCFDAAGGVRRSLTRCLGETAVEAVPRDLVKRYDTNAPVVDDLALIAIRPAGLDGTGETVWLTSDNPGEGSNGDGRRIFAEPE